jgi:hypothetical protein
MEVVFQNNLDGYREWSEQNPNGYVLNVRGGNSSPMLHRTSCGHVFPAKPEYGDFTKKQKVCSTDHHEVERWASDQGYTVVLCPDCDV